jgi:hypothetical protein
MTMRAVSRLLWLGGLVGSLGFATGCNKLKLPGGGLPQGQCGDFETVDGIAKIDFAGKYKLAADSALKLRASLQAAAALGTMANDIDAQVMSACAGMATDLGGSGSFSDAKAACDAAKAALTDARLKVGVKAAISVGYSPPVCSASMSAMADCSAKCSAEVDPGKVEVTCEGGKLSGECSARCEGSCSVEAGAKCEGQCRGECTANFNGKCDGTCNGKCDGKNTEGHCDGKCVGSCDLVASGSCKGECKGTCELKAKAECGGTCTGSCSVEMKAPQCTGEVTPPKATAECKGSCQAQVEAEVSCTEPKVVVNVMASADAELATRYKSGLEKHLPNILKVSIGMKDRIKGVVENALAAAKAGAEVAKAGASAGMEGANLASCVGARIEAAVKASARIEASVSVSVNVSASATASGSAG